MAVAPQFTKQGIINTALILTGNRPCNDGDDGSPEWIVASEAYEAALPVLLASRDWKFQSNVAALVRTGASPLPSYRDAYAKPVDALYLKAVWRTEDAAAWSRAGTPDEPFYDYPHLPPLDYQILNDQIHANAPSGLSAKYTVNPTSPAGLPVLFVEALRRYVMAGIFAGLNEDMDSANAAEKKAALAVQEAASRTDSEQQRRVTFRSPLLEARRRRRGG